MIVLQDTCHEVQEGQTLKIFGLVVAELHNLLVHLPQGFKPIPSIFVVNLLHSSNEPISGLSTTMPEEMTLVFMQSLP